MTSKLKFPEGFLWGAATSAHQVEGGNVNSDWWEWEHSTKRLNELKAKGLAAADFQSGQACDSYHRYEEDFNLAKELGHNAHRLSVEWARIQPTQETFSEKELDHYEKVLQSAQAHGLKTFVTLHHFTNPQWFSKIGGWLNPGAAELFERYAEAVGRRLGQYTDFWITINEPEIYTTHAYGRGKFPPHHKSMREVWQATQNIIRAHNLAAPKLKGFTGKPVSIAYHLSDLQPISRWSNLTASLSHYFANEYILERTISHCDYIGVNYYNHHHIGLFGPRKTSHSGHEVTDLGWGIHPEGLERVLNKLKKYHKPIYITENGLADRLDNKREKFIKQHLLFIHKAIAQGADVRGYLYWSLLDNFEWEKGFAPKFGLIAIDREDLLRRKIRPSALAYAKICKENVLEV